MDRDQFGGRSLIYLPRYLTEEDPFYEPSDETIREQFLWTLESMFPGFRGDQVVAFRVSRARQVLALSTLNYSDALPPMRTSVPGLYLVNSAHIVNGTLNVNETIQLAERAVRVLTESP